MAHSRVTINYDYGHVSQDMFRYGDKFSQEVPLAINVRLDIQPMDGMYYFRVFAFGKVVLEEQHPNQLQAELAMKRWLERSIEAQERLFL